MKISNKPITYSLVLFLAILLNTACSKERIDETFTENEISLRQANTVTICHYSENDGIWKEKHININALEAHRAHGDAVDMDGDGYYDIENGCGPIDCDDNDPSYTDNCCEDYCVFCNHESYSLLNFTDCTEGNQDDYYESRIDDYRGCDYYGCDDFLSSYALIIDSEGYFTDDCDGDLSTWHFGYIYATTYVYCGEEYASTSIYYIDSDGTDIFEYNDITPEQAHSCIAAIDKIAQDLGLENIGSDKTCDDLLQPNNEESKLLKKDKQQLINGVEPLALIKLREQMKKIKGNYISE